MRSSTLIRSAYLLLGIQAAHAGKLNPFKDDPPDAETDDTGNAGDANGPTTYSCPEDNGATYTTYLAPVSTVQCPCF